MLDNQVRYAKNRVNIILKEHDENVRLCISNDGPAINNNFKEELFERFSKGEKGSYGMGLAIVKQIVEMHKGRVWVINEDVGVKFYLEVPILRDTCSSNSLG